MDRIALGESHRRAATRPESFNAAILCSARERPGMLEGCRFAGHRGRIARRPEVGAMILHRLASPSDMPEPASP